MIHLNKALSAWGQEDFPARLRAEIELLPHSSLPLQEGLSYSSYVSDEPFQVMILRVNEEGEQLVAVARLFYSGIIAGCSCADDPTPLDTQTESCLLELRLDKQDASVSFTLLPDE
jgi:hypothetical protein